MPKKPEKFNKLLTNLGDFYAKKLNPQRQVDKNTNEEAYFFEDSILSFEDSSDTDFENIDEITSVDLKLLSDLIEFNLNGNVSRRSLSVLILAVLKY